MKRQYGEGRNKIIPIRLTEKEYEELREKVGNASISDYIRNLIDKDKK